MFWPTTMTIDAERLIQHGPLQIDLARHQVTFRGQMIELSRAEFILLTCLAQAAPQAVPFVYLAVHAYGHTATSPQQTSESLRNSICRLRRKLKEAVGDVELIETVRAVGYALSVPPAAPQPSGLITFLFSDIEGSTKLWEQHPQAMKAALKRHDSILRTTFEAHGGYVFKTVGDGFYVAFSQTGQALAAALAGQRALHREEWPGATRLRVRMALSTGVVEERDGDYYGPSLNLAARLLSAGHGGQILLAQSSQAEIAGSQSDGLELRDLGMRRFKGLNEPQRVFQALAADLPVHFPPLHTLDPRPTNLHAELTSFVGRQEAIRAIGARLRQGEIRLLTLVGPGGIGKTRLSSQVAASLLDEYEDGVFFVPLAPIHDPALIPTAIAQALGAHSSPDRVSVQELVAHLRSRQLLIVLDNFEHLVDAAPLVNDLLRGAPYLKVLVTSREGLRIYGEHLYPVAPLAVPDTHERISTGALSRFPATTLFLQRMQASAPEQRVTDTDAPTVAAICASLDGLPLAIELAAARTGQYSLAEIAAQLNHRLGFLNNGPRDLPARQRTLRGALDWSFDLLTDDEQVLFSRLAVFVGGWTSAAAEQLAADKLGSPGQIADTLASLAAKSLLQYQPGQRPRFTMLESIREYAWDRLQSSGELPAMREKHTAYHRRLVVGFEAELTGEEQTATYRVLKAEEDNLRAALEWSLEQEQDETALEMCGILWHWWAAQSYLREGTSWLEQALTGHISGSAGLRAKALWGAGRLAFFQADLPRAEQRLAESLALYRQLDDPQGVAWVLDAIGAIGLQREEYARAQRLFAESLALHRATGNKRGISHTLDDLGQTAFLQGEIGQAAHLFEESLHLRRESGSQEGTAVAIVNLSEALGLQGEYARAERLLHEGMHIYRQLNQPSGIILCLGNLGQIKGKLGDFAGALACYTESLAYLREVEEEELDLVVEGLIGLVEALHRTGRDAAAAQVLGLTKKRLNDLDANSSLHYDFEQHREAVRSGLDKTEWTRAWDEGERMSLGEMIEMLASG